MEESKNLLVETERAFNPAEVNIYLESASINPAHRPSASQAQQHLSQTLQSVSGTAHDTAQDTAQNAHDVAHNMPSI